MSLYILTNDFLTVQIDSLGAELISICNNSNMTEYLWNADPKYWKRHAPILFPFVGSLKNKSYTYEGKTYPVMQHGFARDMEFNMIKKTDSEIWFSLDATEITQEIYPFEFHLELGYRLEGKTITVLWKVNNPGQSDLHFSIGGHPAFCCPLDPEEQQTEYYLAFDNVKPIHYLHINEEGLVKKNPDQQMNYLTTDEGILPIDPRMFDYDALIIEEHQCQKVSLLDPAKLPYLTVSFDAPLFGLWSPAGKNAPFICIEPWYDRCDAEDFTGTLEEREWGNSLKAGEVFETSYTIEIV